MLSMSQGSSESGSRGVSASETTTTTIEAKGRRPAGRPRGFWIALALLGLVALLIYRVDPPPELDPAIVATLPPEPDRLSPQLRSYVLAKVEWVNQSLGDPERHRTLGLVYEANKLWQEAYNSFTHALALDPDHVLTQYHQARCLIGMGRLEEAEALLAAIAGAHPELAAAVCRWGELLLDRGMFDEAREAFDLVTQHSPKAPHGYVGRGAALVLAGSHQAALEPLRQALARNPQHPRAHYLLGLAYRGLGRKKEALASLKRGAASIVEELPDAWRSELARHGKQLPAQIRFARSSGNGKAAIPLLEEALQWNPADVRLLNALADTFKGLGQCETALEHLARAREAEPDYPGTVIAQAACLVELGRLAEAESAAREAVALGPTLSESHTILAFVLSQSNRNAESLAVIEQARRLDPAEPRLAMKQAQLSLRMDRPEDARRYFEEVVELAPSSIEARASLARLHARRGQWKLANKWVREAMALAPGNQRLVKLAQNINQKARERSP